MRDLTQLPVHTMSDQQPITIDEILKITAAGLIMAVVVIVICILVSPTCGTYIGTNMRNFTAAIRSASSQPTVFRMVSTPSVAATKQRRDMLHDGTGCYEDDDATLSAESLDVSQHLLRHDGEDDTAHFHHPSSARMAQDYDPGRA